MRIALTGATGYIGGRLLTRLLERGHQVTILVRQRERFLAKYPGDELPSGLTIIEGNAEKKEDVAQACADCQQVYYLIHSMRKGEASFADRDQTTAGAFAAGAQEAGVERIIYLGGLGNDQGQISKHLQSRHEVGTALASAKVPVLEFRAAVIVGAGSASFEMIRHLTERLPVMITPRWVNTRCQPIPIRGVLHYLLAALDHPNETGIVEIGGPDVLTYREMMHIFAEERGLRRTIMPVPVLTPKLSSWWVHLVTPVPAAIARPLIEGLRSEVIVRDNGKRAAAFGVTCKTYREAVRLALGRIASHSVETDWCQSFASLSDAAPQGSRLMVKEGLYIEQHTTTVAAPAHTVYQACCLLGGKYGWPAGDFLWRVRALMDKSIGGVGFRRGRPPRRNLLVGDAVDFWRVEEAIPGQLLRLQAEMIMPGRGWLQFSITTDSDKAGRSQPKLTVTAFYEPHGLTGYLYWLATMPLHRFIFPALCHALARRAVLLHRSAQTGVEPTTMAIQSGKLQ